MNEIKKEEESLLNEAEEILKEEEKVEEAVNQELEELEKEETENREIDNNQELEELEEQEESEEEKQEEVKIEKEQKAKKSGLHKWAIAIVVIFVILLISVGVFSTVFALITKSSDKIVSGVSIKGVDISGLTQEEARTKLTELTSAKLKQELKLKHGEYETSILPEQIEANFGIEEAVSIAYEIGRNGNILSDNYEIINTYLSKINITPSFVYNEKALNDFVASITNNLPDKVVQSSYTIENNNLVISRGTRRFCCY